KLVRGETQMESKLANPAPLGLIGFAATTWLLSMINAGIFGKESLPLVLAMALAFGGGAPAPFLGWYLFVWGVFTFYMWIASFRHNTALQLVFLTLWITFFLLAAGDWFGVHSLHVFGGYTGMLCAGIAAYLSAAEVINADYGRTVLPIGARGP